VIVESFELLHKYELSNFEISICQYQKAESR